MACKSNFTQEIDFDHVEVTIRISSRKFKPWNLSKTAIFRVMGVLSSYCHENPIVNLKWGNIIDKDHFWFVNKLETTKVI